MKAILNDIFGEIISAYNKLFDTAVTKLDESKETAKDRLKLVLMHDRTKLSPEMMAKMRDELVEVISRYVEIDKEALDLNLASEGNSIALMASIPVKRERNSGEKEEAQATDKTEEIAGDDEVKDEETVANPIAKEGKKSNNNKSVTDVEETEEVEA